MTDAAVDEAGDGAVDEVADGAVDGEGEEAGEVAANGVADPAPGRIGMSDSYTIAARRASRQALQVRGYQAEGWFRTATPSSFHPLTSKFAYNA